MTFLSILCALLLEQMKPLRADNPIYANIKLFAVRMETWFNAGQASHGRMGWFLVMAALMVPTGLIYWVLLRYNLILGAFAWNVLIVYLTLGFRHYSHYFTSIQLALNAGDEPAARALLSEWTRQDTVGLEANEIARIAVEKALITTHRNVFGVFFWFLLPLGPAAAVMYRVSEYLARAWNEPDHMKNEAFGQFAARAFYWIDWIPARLTAVAFAVVGNFEDAIYAWRNFAHRWRDEAIGIILAAGGGAMGVRLGTPQENAAKVVPADAATVDISDVEVETLPGDEPSVRALQSTVGLVWRALLLWMLLLLLMSGAMALG
ncbi:CobD/CbiB family protein [Pseudoduganella albidiflava]|uniref:Cobalamin biosynthesis protein CobD n=1 Tax=Pseudoduganella albidiflava TaxID=321983 RepID=A0A411X2G4_9BURK|nr:CobD/CbiB family protein [Pseudoduganella albidiflava]QBI03159.1 CobD/CbiB family protein [Pseudoduganella albidiflava]GGY64774.1 cobalamin biosynthesis protein CobD [Pseudoduganella albidiflava]